MNAARRRTEPRVRRGMAPQRSDRTTITNAVLSPQRYPNAERPADPFTAEAQRAHGKVGPANDADGYESVRGTTHPFTAKGAKKPPLTFWVLLEFYAGCPLAFTPYTSIPTQTRRRRPLLTLRLQFCLAHGIHRNHG